MILNEKMNPKIVHFCLISQKYFSVKIILFVIFCMVFFLSIYFYDVTEINPFSISVRFVDRENLSPFAQNDNDDNEYDNQSTKYMLDWTLFFGTPMSSRFEGKHFLDECPEFNCRIVSNKSLNNQVDAILFHAIEINWKRLPLVRYPNQYYVFFSWEAPPVTQFDASLADGYFNLTMSYRLDSDFFSPFGDFRPIPRAEGEKMFRRNKIVESVNNKRKLVVWFASNCNSNSRRELYVEKLQKYIQVDVFGGCGRKICERFDPNCFDILYQYKFYLSFENSLCEGYVSEKLYDRIKYLVVPIVLNESLMYQERSPPKSVISATNFRSVQDLAAYLNYLDKNLTAYMEYFEWRKNYVVTKNWMNGCNNPKRCAFCSLCAFLHRKIKVKKTKNQIYNWWHTNARCDTTLVSRLVNNTN